MSTNPASSRRISCEALQDGDLSSVFRQRYAKPSTDYWGVFTPTAQEGGFGGLPSQVTTTRSLENSSSLVASSVSHISLPVVTSQVSSDDPQSLQLTVPPQTSLERGGNSSLGDIQRRFSFNGVGSWRMDSGDGAAGANHIEAGVLLKAGDALELERSQIKRQRAGEMIRGFHAESTPHRVELASNGWPDVANVLSIQGGRQVHYREAMPCNDKIAEVNRVVEAAMVPMDREWHDLINVMSVADAGLQLVHLLLDCAEAVDNLQFSVVHVLLMRLRVLVEPQSNTMQRLAAIFVTALTARVTSTAKGGFYMGYNKNDAVSVTESLRYFNVVYNSTPFGKFPHVTLNQIILDAVETESSVHVIDLNTEWRGMQWPAFIHALATRPGATTPKLRITAFGRDSDLAHAQKKLLMFAENLQFPLEFCPLAVDLKDFDVKMLDIREGEAICINSFSTLHQFLAAGDSRVHKFFCDLKSLNPRVFAISDTDADHNSPSFLPRFIECLKYFSAVFDALDASIPDRQALLGIEQLLAGQKIRNIIACEGDARIERHESMAGWNRRMLAAGFQRCRISARVVNQASILLTMYYADDFTLSIKEGYVALGWKNAPLVGIAAWCSNHCEPGIL